MSLILDALKKLEQETAARKEGTDKVAAQILRADHVKPKHKRMVILSVASAIVGAMIGVALVGGSSSLIRPLSPVLPASAPISQPVSYAVPVATLPAQTDKTQSPKVLRTSEVRKSTEQPLRQNTQRQSASPIKQGTNTHNEVSDKPKKSAEDSAPSLTVSGIVWFEERSARRAVVNEMVLGEGAIVNGAKIVEIQPNGVLFSHGNEMFGVLLGKAP